jgi:hypothetical protein
VDRFSADILPLVGMLLALLARVESIDELDQRLDGVFMVVTEVTQGTNDLIHRWEILGGNYGDLCLVLRDESRS